MKKYILGLLSAGLVLVPAWFTPVVASADTFTFPQYISPAAHDLCIAPAANLVDVCADINLAWAIQNTTLNGTQAQFNDLDTRLRTVTGIVIAKLLEISQGGGGGANSLRVTAPNGGEQWQLNSTHTILWTPYSPQQGINPAVTQVQAYLERRVNGNFVTLGKIIESGKASIHWLGDVDTYGNLAAPGTNYYVRLVNTVTGESDRSDSAFTIVAANTITASLRLNDSHDLSATTIPEGGQDVTATWTSNASSCNLGINSRIQGGYQQISDLAASGSRTIRLLPTTDSVSLWCNAVSPIEGAASDFVTVLPPVNNTTAPSVRVTSPNGGETISRGTLQRIDISVSGLSKISVALYKNDATYAWIGRDIPISGITNYGLSWTPANNIASGDVGTGATYKIYVIGYKADGTGTIEDKSDAPFTIINSTDTVAIDNLNNRNWNAGDTKTIRWNIALPANTPASASRQVILTLARTSDDGLSSEMIKQFPTLTGKTEVGETTLQLPSPGPFVGVSYRPGVYQIIVTVIPSSSQTDGRVAYSQSFTISAPTTTATAPVLSLRGVYGNDIQVDWTNASTASPSSYTVWRDSGTRGITFLDLATIGFPGYPACTTNTIGACSHEVPASTRSWRDAYAKAPGVYTYVVIANYPSSNDNRISNSVTATAGTNSTVTRPTNITNLTATVSGVNIVLTWTKPTGHAAYDVYRSTASNIPLDDSRTTALQYQLNKDAITFTDTRAQAGVTYYYTVVPLSADHLATGSNTNGGSNFATARVGAGNTATRANPVTNFTAVREGNNVRLRWTAPTAATAATGTNLNAGYTLYRRTTNNIAQYGTANGGIWLPIADLTHLDGATSNFLYPAGAPQAGQTYYYWIYTRGPNNAADNSAGVMTSVGPVGVTPTISSLTPATGPVGTRVTVSGTNIAQGDIVEFGSGAGGTGDTIAYAGTLDASLSFAVPGIGGCSVINADNTLGVCLAGALLGPGNYSVAIRKASDPHIVSNVRTFTTTAVATRALSVSNFAATRQNDGSIRLTWTRPTGDTIGTKYVIFRRTAGGYPDTSNGGIHVPITATEWIDNGSPDYQGVRLSNPSGAPLASQTYYYTIFTEGPRNGADNSGPTYATGGPTAATRANPVTNFTAVREGNNVRLRWDAPAAVTAANGANLNAGYVIYRRANSNLNEFGTASGGVWVSPVTTLTYLDTGGFLYPAGAPQSSQSYYYWIFTRGPQNGADNSGPVMATVASTATNPTYSLSTSVANNVLTATITRSPSTDTTSLTLQIDTNSLSVSGVTNSVQNLSLTTITAGSHTLYLKNGSTVVAQSAFTVPSAGATAPAISSISPTNGTVGTTITITGTNFAATGNTVTIGSVTAGTNLASSNGQIQVTVPASLESGSQYLVRVTANGVADVLTNIYFSVTAAASNPAVSVSSVSNSGQWTVGSSQSVNWSASSLSTGGLFTVYAAPSGAGAVLTLCQNIADSARTCSFTVPTGSSGSHDILVTYRKAGMQNVTNPTVTHTVTIATANRVPRNYTFTPSATTLVSGTSYNLDFSAIDDDGDPLTFSLTWSGGSTGVETKVVTCAAGTVCLARFPKTFVAGSHVLLVNVRDGRGGELQQQYTLPVSAPAITKVWQPSTDGWGPAYCNNDQDGDTTITRYRRADGKPLLCGTPSTSLPALTGSCDGYTDYNNAAATLVVKTAYDIAHNFKCVPANTSANLSQMASSLAAIQAILESLRSSF